MEEGTIEQKPPAEKIFDSEALEHAVQNVLKNYLSPLESTSDARGTFYNKFKREADGYDTDFLKKYGDDLDITLIFAALFSAVVSAFVVAVQTQIRPDYTQLSYDLLWMMANSTHQDPPAKPSSDSPWSGPDPNLVHVQAILFSSLALSLLASFVAMLGKQWLNRYSKVDMRGSLIDRSRDRQRKMNGMADWGFKLVMESLPLMLQAALLLLGCALSKYLFTIDNLVALVVVVFTASGFLFYVIIVIAAIISYDCPFQTPVSLIVRRVGNLFKERKKHPQKWKWFPRTFKWQGQQPGELFRLAVFGAPAGNNPDQAPPVAIVDPPHPPPVLFGDEGDKKDYMLDSNCIAWMFERSMDPDVILDIMKFIPEIIWHTGIHTTPLEKLYDTVLECFDNSTGSLIVTPKFRDKAYLSAKAFLHLAIQRKCMGDGSDTDLFDGISLRHQQYVGSKYFESDADLDSTLAMIDHVFANANPKPDPWQDFSFTGPHHTWMSRILLCYAWGALKKGNPLPTEVMEFVRYSLALVPPPPAQAIRDCLYVVGMALKIEFDNDDPSVSLQIQKILDALIRTFRNTTDIDCALEAVELITAHSDKVVATESYKLFSVIMQRLVSTDYTEEKKWKAARLALHGAYKYNQDEDPPQVEDLKPILDFLRHHFKLVEKDEDHDGPIRNALHALSFNPTPETIEALKNFDPTQQSFVHGICHVFQENKPLQLREAALSFLPLIADKFFNTGVTIMKDEDMKGLCENWASAVDEVWGAESGCDPALAVLLDMINSSQWRPYVVPDKWKLLEHFDSVSDDSQPLARCLRNPDLVDAISTGGNQDAMDLWSKILLSKCDKLDPTVEERLEASMRDPQRKRVDEYLSTVRAELEEAEKDSAKYGTWAITPEAMALNARIESHEAAIRFLESVKNS